MTLLFDFSVTCIPLPSHTALEGQANCANPHFQRPNSLCESGILSLTDAWYLLTW